MNFGGNLYMRISKRGDRAFHFRICLDGKDTTHSIGRFPDLSLSEAQQIANQWQGEVVQARKKNAVAAFRAQLKVTKQKPALKKVEKQGDSRSIREGGGFAGFRSLEDAGKFIASLRDNRDFMLPEIYFWLRLSLLIPSRSDALLSARWSDIDKEKGIWTIRKPNPLQNKSNGFASKAAWLSGGVRRMLDELQPISCKADETGELFPSLKSMSASTLRLSIRQAIERVWPQYYVNPAEFAAFFEGVAKKYSLFHPALVDQMLAHKPGSLADYNHTTYITQLCALTGWWSDTLDWFAFNESLIPWGGTHPPERPSPKQDRARWAYSNRTRI